MSHHSLREIAKVASGLVLADIISVIWFASAGIFPVTLLGVKWTGAMVPEILFFDVALLILLAHMGWNTKVPVATPSERTLLTVAGVIFLVIAIVHLVRLTFGATIILGGFAIPLWLSWVGVFVAGYLGYSCLHFAHRGRR